MDEMKAVEKAAKKQRRKRMDAVKVHEDPRLELRLLVKRRNDQIRMRNALANMTSPRTARKDTPDLGWKKGDKIPPSLSEDLCMTIQGFIQQIDKPNEKGLSAIGDDSQYGTIAETEAAIVRELNAIRKTETPVGDVARFLHGIHGLGDMTTAALISAVDFEKCVKPSQLIRFCGLGIATHKRSRDRLECRALSRGQKLHYNTGLRTTLWNAGESIARASTAAGQGVGSKYSTKYTDIWRNYAERMKHSPRVLAEHNLIDIDLDGRNADRVRRGEMTMEEVKRSFRSKDRDEEDSAEKRGEKQIFRSAAGFIRSTGRWKMIEAILYDLYLVGRAAYGLPVYCTWHEKARGRAHGTDETIDANAPPKLLTVAEALEAVGHTGKIAAAAE